MNLKEIIYKRRALRSLEPVEITEDLVKDLAECSQIAASCFNNQPWRYVFVYDEEMLKTMHTALSPGNVWAKKSSMIIAVLSRKEMDCIIKDREYYLFDTGMATAQMILRATELDLVAHPIAGYNPNKVKEILNIPKEMTVITLLIVGKKAASIDPELSDGQKKSELNRPERQSLDRIAFINRYK